MWNVDDLSLWDEVTNLMKNHQKEIHPVSRIINPQDLLMDLKSSDGQLIDTIQTLLKYSPQTSNPHFYNQLSAGIHIESLLGEMVAIYLNGTMSTFEASPVATLIEKETIGYLLHKFGIDSGSGIMVPGASLANLQAIHCARQKICPDSKVDGNGQHKFCVFVSDQAHYSFKKAAILAGIGLKNLVRVKSHKNGEMDSESLRERIENALKKGMTPLMIGSTAGTTVFGRFDHIEKNQKIAEEYQLWHHIDGAWGGVAIFHPQHKQLLYGIQRADSVAFDTHKLLGSGLMSAFYLTRHEHNLLETNASGGKEYLFHDYENSALDLGRYSLQCGRKIDILKFWFLWKRRGEGYFEKLIINQWQKADDFRKKILNHPRFNYFPQSHFLNICFQVCPKNTDTNINEYNLIIRKLVLKSGKAMINYSSFKDGTIFFRMVLSNLLTESEHLDQLIQMLIAYGDEAEAILNEKNLRDLNSKDSE